MILTASCTADTTLTRFQPRDLRELSKGQQIARYTYHTRHSMPTLQGDLTFFYASSSS
jgi:hypothetical protein